MKTIKMFIILGLFAIVNFPVSAQETKVTIYNPSADAKYEINAAVKKAVSENKHVLIQVGGNWCPWCVKLHNLYSESSIDSILKADYILVMVNYSKENKNVEVLKELDFPQRFGFPVLVVLNQKGIRIHTQDTGFLEGGTGYDIKKVAEFLNGWTVKAVSPESYVFGN